MPRTHVTRGALPYTKALERIRELEARVAELEAAAAPVLEEPPAPPARKRAPRAKK